LVLAGSGGAYWAIKMREPPPSPALTAPIPVIATAPQATDDEDAKAYLDAAEKLAGQKRYEPALDMIKKAGELKIRNSGLNIRLAQLRDTLTTASLLKKAQSHLAERQYRAAIDSAKEVLDRAPDNADALQILSTARAALQPKEEATASKRKEHARDGYLTISTTPPGTVYVDDEPIGRSPLDRRTLSAGKHTIQVRAQGYRPYTGDIRVQPGQNFNMVVPLVADGATPGARPASKEDDSPLAHVPTAPSARPGRPTEGPRETEPPSVSPASLNVTPPSPAATPPPTPAPVVASTVKSQPRPAAPSAPAPPATSGSVMSAAPRSPVPKPTLPRVFQAKDPDRLNQVFNVVESATISLAGVTPEYARGITGPLRRLMGANAEVYPVAIYYFIVREAALKHDKKTAAGNLASAYSNGLILKFKNLPAIEQNL
jgi:hypothetical protein